MPNPVPYSSSYLLNKTEDAIGQKLSNKHIYIIFLPNEWNYYLHFKIL